MASIVVKIVPLCVLFSVFVTETQGHTVKRPVSDLCLGCICAAVSNCETRVCKGYHCGIFTISRPFWEDAGKPTLAGQSPNDTDAYQSCSNNDYCAVETVQNYMSIYRQDCNNDGRVTCYDYLAIHQRGGFQCQGSLSPARLEIFNQCLLETEQD